MVKRIAISFLLLINVILLRGQASCNNEDFELSLVGPVTNSTSILGWTVTSGGNTGLGSSCSLTSCCVGQPNAVDIIGNGYTDPLIGAPYLVYSIFGSTSNIGNTIPLNAGLSQMHGNNFIRINDAIGNFGAHKLSKIINVTPTTALFKLAYISTFSNAHTCCDAGGLKIKLTNITTGSIISCPNFSFTGLSTSCSPTSSITYYNAGSNIAATSASSSMFNPWQINSLDLSPYMGNAIQIDIISFDCTAGAHASCAYIDCQCGPLEVISNGIPFLPGMIPTCGAPFLLITGPPGFNSYQWSTTTGNPVLIGSPTITVGLAGTYTLSLGSTCYTTLAVFQVSITPAAFVSGTTSSSTLCLGNSATLTASGLLTYTWNTGATTANIVVSPTTTTNYTVSGGDGNGCLTTNTLTQVVSACTGIDNINKPNGFNLYPNPNNGEFTLKVETQLKNSELIIENTLGQIVFTLTVQQGENKIKTKNLAQGIYYYTVLENKQAVGKGKLKIE